MREEEVFEISVELTADQHKTYREKPAEAIKRLLTQEGLRFKNVIITDDLKSTPISHLRCAWFHIVYDAANPGLVCVRQIFRY